MPTPSLITICGRLRHHGHRVRSLKIQTSEQLWGLDTFSDQDINTLLVGFASVTGPIDGLTRREQEHRLHDAIQFAAVSCCPNVKEVFYINERFEEDVGPVAVSTIRYIAACQKLNKLTLVDTSDFPLGLYTTLLSPCPPTKHLKIHNETWERDDERSNAFYTAIRAIEGLETLELIGDRMLQLEFFTLPLPFSSALTSLILLDEEPTFPISFDVLKPFLESFSTSLSHLSIGIDVDDVPPSSSAAGGAPSIDLPLLTHLSYDHGFDRFDLFPLSPVTRISHLAPAEPPSFIDDILPPLETYAATLEVVHIGWKAQYDPERWDYPSEEKAARLPGLKKKDLERLREECLRRGVRLSVEPLRDVWLHLPGELW
jgi:hypothetical protein